MAYTWIGAMYLKRLDQKLLLDVWDELSDVDLFWHTVPNDYSNLQLVPQILFEQ